MITLKFNVSMWIHVIVEEITGEMIDKLKENILRMEHDINGIEIVFIKD